MHQVSMALLAFFTREMRTSRRKGRSRLLCTIAEFAQNSPIIVLIFNWKEAGAAAKVHYYIPEG